ncbi:hypothetical protein LRS74_07420 [Streptomyces sp. LX-29]|uniref:hypothetical protein n=1 Tax=Streptomyces sp. LX-29 TaxID=2900152 RepID=UPI00240CF976|nr:hypothetical protein [Streptomyces sp. LX-29]WFB06894.1 hypothetical protein LRS74_07420 [Streptomyces sp. LX-29]
MKRRTLLRGAVAGAAAVPVGSWLGGAANAAPVDFPVAICEQHSNRFLVHDRTERWNDATVNWVFDPGKGRTGWDNPFEIRFRDTRRYGTLVLMTAGKPKNGRAGIVRFGRWGSRLGHGDLLWEAPVSSYPHSIERVPDKLAVVVAGSRGALHVFGPKSSDVSTLREVQTLHARDLGALKEPHGVLWDDQLKLLWVIGGPILRSYEVVGGLRSCRLRKVGRDIDLRRGVPEGKHHGHDLQPDYTNPRRLLITDTNGVYWVDRRTREKGTVWYRQPASKLVKSYVIHASGQAMWTRDSSGTKDDRFGDDTVYFSSGGHRRQSEAQIYKARIVTTRFH